MSIINDEEIMLNDIVSLKESVQKLCIHFSDVRNKIENIYKETLSANVFKTLVNGNISSELLSSIDILIMQSEKYKECIGVVKDATSENN